MSEGFEDVGLEVELALAAANTAGKQDTPVAEMSSAQMLYSVVSNNVENPINVLPYHQSRAKKS